MANSYNNLLRLIQMGNGDQSGTWGATTNQNLATLVCEAVAGAEAVTVSATPYTLTEYDGVADQSRNAIISLSGDPGSNATIVIPDTSKVYIFQNAMSNSRTATVQRSSGGDSVTIANGDTVLLFCDGSGVYLGVTSLPAGATIGGVEVVSTTGTETLTNKTLTSPTINSPTISGGTISSLSSPLALTDGGTGATTAAGVRTNIGLDTTDSPQFLAVNIGDASDTTLTRSDAGILAVEGVVIPTISSTATITNKRNQKRVNSSSNPSSITPSIASYDMEIVTSLAQTLTINAPTGSPIQGESIIIRIKDNGTSRTLSWNSVYRSVGATLPTATTAGKTTYIGAIYNSTDAKWDVVAAATEA